MRDGASNENPPLTVLTLDETVRVRERPNRTVPVPTGVVTAHWIAVEDVHEVVPHAVSCMNRAVGVAEPV